MEIRWVDDDGKRLSRSRRTELARDVVAEGGDFLMTGDTLVYVLREVDCDPVVYDCKIRRIATITRDDLEDADDDA